MPFRTTMNRNLAYLPTIRSDTSVLLRALRGLPPLASLAPWRFQLEHLEGA